MRNIVADTMHGLLGGILPYETDLVFYQLVLVDKVIDYGHFNSIIHNFNYQFESSKPYAVTKEWLKQKFIKIRSVRNKSIYICRYISKEAKENSS